MLIYLLVAINIFSLLVFWLVKRDVDRYGRHQSYVVGPIWNTWKYSGGVKVVKIIYLMTVLATALVSYWILMYTDYVI